MTAAEYIFDYLQKKRLETVYMVSGSSAMWLTDALCRNKKLQAVCCHHEQAAAMSADGYARVHGMPGACLVTIGPGATNAVTGVAQAYLDSSPMFVLSGQVNSRLLRQQREKGIRQLGTQALDLEGIVTPITKYFRVIMEPGEVVPAMEEAYQAAMAGRKGPVWLDVPVDIQNRQVPESAYETAGQRVTADAITAPASGLLGEKRPDYVDLARRLVAARKPLILAGGGIRAAEAVEELAALAAALMLPVATSRGGIDVTSSDDPWYVGRPGAYGDRASHFAVAQCDCLLILGSRLSISTIGYYPERLAQYAHKVMVDIDPPELTREDVPIQEKYCMDVKIFLQELLARAKDAGAEGPADWRQAHTDWNGYLQGLRTRYPTVLPEYKLQKPLNEYYVTQRLSAQVPAGANIVVDTGSVCNVVSQSWELKKGQRYLISGGLSCMGFWATAIGAYQKGRALLAVTGDGSAQMNIQELATLKKNKIPLKLFIYQNHGYMLIRHNQHNYMQDRFLGVGPDSGVETPDFVKVAQAYGIKACQIESAEDLETVIPQVLQESGPVVCQIVVQDFAPIVPRIASKVMPDGSLKAAEFDDLAPFLSEQEYKENLYE